MSQALSFVKCPCCCGHEVISAAAADRLATLIDISMDSEPAPIRAELENIRNSILNFQQHEAIDIDPLLA